MKTTTLLSKSPDEMLEDLMQTPRSFNETANTFFAYSYADYNLLFELDSITVKAETCKRITVLQSEECVACLLIWGIDCATAIHDHRNYDGRIKILKGSLTEVSYRENSNFIEYNGAKTAFAGDIFPEEFGGIHSIVNNSDETAVSLHIYKNRQLNLDGVRLFDTENRRIAWLGDSATSCSWSLSGEAYKKIVNI